MKPNTDSHAPFRLFFQLMGQALQHLGGGAPVVLIDDASIPTHIPTELGWATISTQSAEDLTAKIIELSAQGPVLLAPSWERHTRSSFSERGTKQPQFRYEDVLRHSRPSARDSLIAVLLPASAVSSETPWAVATREAVAEHWDTVAVVYGDGLLPWAHPSFTIAGVFLRGRAASASPLRMYRLPVASSRAPQKLISSNF